MGAGSGVAGDVGFAAAVARVCVSVQREDLDPRDRLTLITEGAVSVIPHVDGAAVVVAASNGRGLAARAVTGSLPPLVTGLQNELGQGPCLDALGQSGQVQVPDVVWDARWPLFAPRAAALGARGMICTPLAVGHTVWGSLSLLSGRANRFDQETASLAAIFATHAALALWGPSGADTRRRL